MFPADGCFLGVEQNATRREVGVVLGGAVLASAAPETRALFCVQFWCGQERVSRQEYQNRKLAHGMRRPDGRLSLARACRPGVRRRPAEQYTALVRSAWRGGVQLGAGQGPCAASRSVSAHTGAAARQWQQHTVAGDPWHRPVSQQHLVQRVARLGSAGVLQASSSTATGGCEGPRRQREPFEPHVRALGRLQHTRVPVNSTPDDALHSLLTTPPPARPSHGQYAPAHWAPMGLAVRCWRRLNAAAPWVRELCRCPLPRPRVLMHTFADFTEQRDGTTLRLSAEFSFRDADARREGVDETVASQLRAEGFVLPEPPRFASSGAYSFVLPDKVRAYREPADTALGPSNYGHTGYWLLG